MHRRDLVLDDRAFELVDSMVEDGFCLCGIVTDAEGRPVDYRFLRVNRLFGEMTGLHGAEGRTALELVPGLERKWIEAYGRVALDGETLRFVDGSEAMGRVFEVSARPVAPEGCFAILFRDVTALRRAEREREAALEAAQGMLAELHHRVMNSFAQVAAMAALEARGAPPDARAALERLGGRVQALGALYRRLDAAQQADRVDMGAHIAGLAEAVRATLPPSVAVVCEAEPIEVPTKAALPLALVANELLSEAGRRAGPGPATLRLTFGPAEGGVRLAVEDDAGAPPAPEVPRDVGRALLRAFATELGARLADEATATGRRVALDLPRP